MNTLSGNLPFFSHRFDEAIDAIQNEIVLSYPAADGLFTTRELRYEKLNDFIEQQVADLPLLLGHLASIVLAGVLIPFGLKALRIDPALASAIMLTTVTDVVGFFLFLGLAAFVLGYFPGAL